MSDDECRLIDELVSVASTRGDDAREALARRLRAAADELRPSPPRVARGHARTARGRRRNDDDEGNEGNEGNENDGFDFAAYPSRNVALRVMYAGWDYRGFASQGAEQDGVRTVEEALFRALKRVRLIAPDATWKTCDYTRCGRTDAGVSALGQVVSARLRCRVPRRDDDDDGDGGDEIDYPAVLNRALPRDIRILGWTYVSPAFSARFDCEYRHYKYFFTDWNGLDVSAMNEAASAFVGEHDFRNFCKMDARNVHNYRRRIDSCRVVVNGPDSEFVRVGAMGLGGGGGGGASGGKEGDEEKAGARLATSPRNTVAGEPPGWRTSRSSAPRSCGTRFAASRPSSSSSGSVANPPASSRTCSTSRGVLASRSTRWRPRSPSYCGGAGLRTCPFASPTPRDRNWSCTWRSARTGTSSARECGRRRSRT